MGVPLNGMATQDLMEVLMVSRSALEFNKVDELIPELLRHLEGIFKTGNSTFFFARHFAQALNLDRVITRGIEDKFLTQFRDYYHRQDPFLKGLQLPCASVLTTEQLISFKDLTRCEYYNDFLRPQSIHHQMSIYLKSDQRLLGILSLFRPQTAKRFSSLDMAKADLMAPYLSGALEKSIISQKMVERRSFIDSIVAGLPYKGIMVMDASLDPIYQDENAVRILSDLNRAKKPGDASFEPLPRDIYLRCKDLLTSVGQEQAFEPRQIQFDLVSPGHKQKISIQLRLITNRGKNPLLLLCFDPEEPLSCLLKRSRKHGLTGREIEVVSLLSEGLTNKEIGRRLFISEYTVENHLRSIYRKMGVKNRTSLVHRLIQQTSTDNWLTHSSLPN
ncbi:MAG: helix-turn-helix transcriptional regulator [Desulfobacteraceae bacterium]|nr:helix-turn-helix transcriptional regulator [Desulfobacteraceae bacterium]